MQNLTRNQHYLSKLHIKRFMIDTDKGKRLLIYSKANHSMGDRNIERVFSEDYRFCYEKQEVEKNLNSLFETPFNRFLNQFHPTGDFTEITEMESKIAIGNYVQSTYLRTPYCRTQFLIQNRLLGLITQKRENNVNLIIEYPTLNKTENLLEYLNSINWERLREYILRINEIKPESELSFFSNLFYQFNQVYKKVQMLEVLKLVPYISNLNPWISKEFEITDVENLFIEKWSSIASFLMKQFGDFLSKENLLYIITLMCQRLALNGKLPARIYVSDYDGEVLKNKEKLDYRQNKYNNWLHDTNRSLFPEKKSRLQNEGLQNLMNPYILNCAKNPKKWNNYKIEIYTIPANNNKYYFLSDFPILIDCKYGFKENNKLRLLCPISPKQCIIISNNEDYKVILEDLNILNMYQVFYSRDLLVCQKKEDKDSIEEQIKNYNEKFKFNPRPLLKFKMIPQNANYPPYITQI